MTAHADDIAALRRLLEGVEGFAERMGWRRVNPKADGLPVRYATYWTNGRRVVHPRWDRANRHDIALAVGVAMEMLRERLGMSIVQALQAIQERVVINAVHDRSGRLLPLLADVLCEPAGREGSHAPD